MIHIGGGAAQGRKLHTVAGRHVRPTSGMVRQALFNMLRERLVGAIFVDLFAGTGSVGLEAVSCGARQVYFVEHDARALVALRANIMHCAAAEQACIVAASLPVALRHLPVAEPVDMLFLDPPYMSTAGEVTLAALERYSLMSSQGMIIWQHAARRSAPPVVIGWPLWKTRTYGETQLSFYVREEVDRAETASLGQTALEEGAV